MKNKFKRILSLVMVLVMLCAVLPASALAAESDFLIWRNGMLSVYKGPGGNVVIPDGVIHITNSAFDRRADITSVVIPDSVTKISERAFRGCTGLTSIVIPNSVTEIGEQAFSECTGLTSIVIPDSVISIGTYAFMGCTSLTSIVIPSSVTSIGHWAFSNCTSLTDVTISDGVTSVGVHAFGGCTSLTNVVIPGSLTRFGTGAFESYTTLTRATDTSGSTSAPAAEPQTLAPGQKFSDVSPTAWYAEAINAMAETDLLQGDGNGHFNPNRPITYGEFATLMCRIYGLPIKEHECHRNVNMGIDCDGSYSWASSAIWTTCKLHRKLDGSFGFLTYWDCTDANELMNRGETMHYLMLMYFTMHPEISLNYNKFMKDREANGETDYRIEEFKYTQPFTTVDGLKTTLTRTGKRIVGVADENLNDMPDKVGPGNHNWYINAIAAAYALDLVHGDENGYFNPRNTLTRAELCQLMYNMGIDSPGCVKLFDV